MVAHFTSPCIFFPALHKYTDDMCILLSTWQLCLPEVYVQHAILHIKSPRPSQLCLSDLYLIPVHPISPYTEHLS
jgi:hypothetical protein